MNKAILKGRLTKDIELRYSQSESQTAIARFTLAVDRRFKREGDAEADFISCVSFGRTAEFLEKYFSKGSELAVVGRIQTGSYEKDGQRIYTTDVVAEEAYFCGSKSSNTGSSARRDDGFMTIPDGVDDEGLPFGC